MKPGGKKLELVRARLDAPKPPKRRHKQHKAHMPVTRRELSLVRGWLGAGMTLPAAAAVLGRSTQALKYHLMQELKQGWFGAELAKDKKHG